MPSTNSGAGSAAASSPGGRRRDDCGRGSCCMRGDARIRRGRPRRATPRHPRGPTSARLLHPGLAQNRPRQYDAAALSPDGRWAGCDCRAGYFFGERRAAQAPEGGGATGLSHPPPACPKPRGAPTAPCLPPGMRAASCSSGIPRPRHRPAARANNWRPQRRAGRRLPRDGPVLRRRRRRRARRQGRDWLCQANLSQFLGLDGSLTGGRAHRRRAA